MNSNQITIHAGRARRHNLLLQDCCSYGAWFQGIFHSSIRQVPYVIFNFARFAIGLVLLNSLPDGLFSADSRTRAPRYQDTVIHSTLLVISHRAIVYGTTFHVSSHLSCESIGSDCLGYQHIYAVTWYLFRPRSPPIRESLLFSCRYQDVWYQDCVSFQRQVGYPRMLLPFILPDQWSFAPLRSAGRVLPYRHVLHRLPRAASVSAMRLIIRTRQ